MTSVLVMTIRDAFAITLVMEKLTVLSQERLALTQSPLLSLTTMKNHLMRKRSHLNPMRNPKSLMRKMIQILGNQPGTLSRKSEPTHTTLKTTTRVQCIK